MVCGKAQTFSLSGICTILHMIIKKVQKHLCQTCLDKVLAVMEVYGPEDETAKPRDLCLVDFQTLELYSLQGDYIFYYIRDYYVQVDDSKEEEVKISAIYAPVLENGKKGRGMIAGTGSVGYNEGNN